MLRTARLARRQHQQPNARLSRFADEIGRCTMLESTAQQQKLFPAPVSPIRWAAHFLQDQRFVV
jgi:hypothetical protein